MKSFARQDERIRLEFNESNRGVAATRNRGLEMARGDYVYFLDSDDMLLPDALPQMAQSVAPRQYPPRRSRASLKRRHGRLRQLQSQEQID